jgi:hypothetical protein
MRNHIFRSRSILVTAAAVVAVCLWLGFGGNEQEARMHNAEPVITVDQKFSQADNVTASIRSASRSAIYVPVSSKADIDAVRSRATVISEHGSFVIASATSSAKVSSFGEGAYKLDQKIALPGASFDPVIDPPANTVHAGGPERAGKGYYVVQLGGIATDDVLNSLRGSGLDVIQYVPNNAFLVYGEGEAAGLASSNSRVRWVGEYIPEWKIATDVSRTPETSKDGKALYNVSIFSRADLDSVTNEILARTNGELVNKVELQSSYFNSVRVSMDPSMLDTVAGIADVVRIDSYAFPQREDERAARIVSGNYTNQTTISGPGYDPLTQFGVDGTNVTLAMVDDGVSIPGNGGFYLTTANTVNANLRGATAGAGGGHGHINASIISGTTPFGNLDTLGYNYGLGIAPKSHILNIPLLKGGYTGSDSTVADDTVTTVGPNGVTGTISNNSWGNGTNGNVYEGLAATYDSLSRDASLAGTVDPLLYVFSAGNSGASGLTRPKMAKNVIAVANSENLRTELSASANNIDDMASGSSRGPAADGRIKPDIAAPGSVITGSRAGGCTSVSSCFEANHAWSSGTSHAAPQIAGVAALFEQFWKNGHAGMRSSIAMTKAAILQTGQEMNGVGTASPIPNGDEGWGRANMKFMLNTGVPMKYVDQSTNFLSPGDNVVYNGKVVDGTKPFRATLVWTDPPGVADPALVNNLDLTITINGNTYRGNNFAAGLSVAGGSSDIRNNVEHIWLNGLAADTTVSISVNAAALNGDGIIGNGDATDQHFALVVYNYSDVAPTHFNVSGRITSQSGRGVANTFVELMSGPTVVARTRSNSFGYYTLFAVPGNASYTATVKAKGYTFNDVPVVLGSSNLQGVNFTSTTGFP